MRIPKYRLHKPSGRAVFQFAPLFGEKRVYLKGPYGSEESLAEYECLRAKAADYLFSSRPATAPRSRQSTIADLCGAFLDWSEGHHGKKEYDHYRLVVRKLYEKHEHARIVDFGPLALRDVRQSMISANWSRTHINHQVNRVRFLFKWGVEHEWADASLLANLQAVAPLRKGKTKARETDPVEPVSWEEAEKLLPYICPMLGAMMRVQYLTGMRSSELTKMRPVMCSPYRDVLVYQPDEHKTAWLGKRKVVCIGPQAKALIEPYLPSDPEHFIFRPATALAELAAARAASRKTKRYGKDIARAPKPRLVSCRYDYHSYQAALNHGFRKWAKAISGKSKIPAKPKAQKFAAWLAEFGIDYWHPHQLRHTRGTITRSAYGIEGAQAQLGNTLEATEIYAEKSLELARRIASETG